MQIIFFIPSLQEWNQEGPWQKAGEEGGGGEFLQKGKDLGGGGGRRKEEGGGKGGVTMLSFRSLGSLVSASPGSGVLDQPL